MLDTINTEITQDNARVLNNLFAGKQIMDARDRDGLHARNAVAFTDGTYLTIQAATALPNGRYLLADSLDMDTDNFVNSDDHHYKKWDSGRVIRAWAETTITPIADENDPMIVDQEKRTVTLWALTENNLRPEKIAETTGTYVIQSPITPTLIIESSDGTTISAADAALKPQW